MFKAIIEHCFKKTAHPNYIFTYTGGEEYCETFEESIREEIRMYCSEQFNVQCPNELMITVDQPNGDHTGFTGYLVIELSDPLTGLISEEYEYTFLYPNNYTVNEVE